MKRLLMIAVMVACAGMVMAAEEQAVPTGPGSAELEQIKALAGRWEGAERMGEGEAQPTVVEYKVTSGGSAVVETLAPGTPHEMVSVYHDVDSKLAMTHYCMLGNQPRLTLVGSNADEIHLSLADTPGINAAVDRHMHALTIAWQDSDHITQTWTLYNNGAQEGTTVFSLSRVR